MNKPGIQLGKSLDYYIWKEPKLVATIIHLAKRKTKRQFYNRLQYAISKSNLNG